jgi:APA family basic amino acid/polyamine antiporter
LRRTIGVVQATAMVAGTIIGASIFVQPSEIIRHVPTVPGMMAAWLLCGLLTLCGALVCAELAAVYPQSGGVYVFLKETFSPALGFLWGWAMLWSIHSGIIAAIAVVFARYVGFFVPMDDMEMRGVALGGIVLLSTVNYFGVRTGSAVQTVLTLAKLTAIVAVLVLAMVLRPDSAPGTLAPVAALPGAFSVRDFVLALSAGLFAYGGWHMVTYPAGETCDPQRTIPRALLLGVLIVTACYLGLNAAYLSILPTEQVAASTRIAADAATALVGPRGGAAISALVMLSSFGAMSGIILAGPRVYYAMAQDGLLFRWMGAVHPRYQTPHWAIVAQAGVASVLVATGTYRALFTRVVYSEWLFFALLAAALFKLRRNPKYRPAYRMWGYPVAPLLFIAASVTIVVNQVVSDPKESVVGMALVLAGIPVYYLRRRFARNTQG